jgi:hypothetical protein
LLRSDASVSVAERETPVADEQERTAAVLLFDGSSARSGVSKAAGYCHAHVQEIRDGVVKLAPIAQHQ